MRWFDTCTLAHFVGDAPIDCLAVLPSDIIAAGDAIGRVLFLRQKQSNP